MSLLLAVLVIVLGVLVVAWVNGGIREQRLIVEPVRLPVQETGS